MTPNDLITLALKQAGVIGVGQTPLAEDMNDAFTLLNMMLGQWNRKRWLIFHEVDVAFSANGKESYTIGPGGDIIYPYRPDRLEGAFVRYVQNGVRAGLRELNADTNADFNADFVPVVPLGPDQNQGIDYPLRLIQSREDWSAIAIKTIGQGAPAFPQAVFYDPAFPLGNVYVWPVAQAPFEVHLLLKEELAQIPTITTPINLPNEYLEAVLYNLAVRLWDHYGMPPREVTIGLARAALNTIRNANTQVPLLRLPSELSVRSRGNVIDLLSGAFDY